MSDDEVLRRRRAINRKAATKSRRKQKEQVLYVKKVTIIICTKHMLIRFRSLARKSFLHSERGEAVAFFFTVKCSELGSGRSIPGFLYPSLAYRTM